MLSTAIEDAEAVGVLVMSIVQQSRIAGMELFWARVFGTSCAETVGVYAQTFYRTRCTIKLTRPSKMSRSSAPLKDIEVMK